MSADLKESIQQTTSGWVEVQGWETAGLHETGRFLFGDPLGNKLSQFHVPKSGIYFVSANVGFKQANLGSFRISVNTDKEIPSAVAALSAIRSGQSDGSDFTLSLGGFAELQAGDKVSIFAHSEKDTDWIIKDESQFCLIRVGRIGVIPGFAARREKPVTYTMKGPHTIRKWKINGSPGLFESLTGFSPSTGRFVCVCEGLYFIAANIHLVAGYGEYSLSFSVNGAIQDLSVYVNSQSQENLFTLHLYGTYHLSMGDSLTLEINSSRNEVSYILNADSSFSVSYIRSYNQSVPEGVSTVLRAPRQIPGAGKLEVKMWPPSQPFSARFHSAKTLQKGRFTCTTGGIYFITVNLKLKSSIGQHSLLVISSGKSDTSGNGGIFTTYHNKVKKGQFSLILTGLLELSYGEYLSIFVDSKSNYPWTIEAESSFSAVKTHYNWPAVHSHYSNVTPALNNGSWIELTSWTNNNQKGTFTFGNNLSPKSGRYIVTSPGVHFIATNLIFLRTDGSKVEALVAVNGIINTNNGFYAVHDNPPKNFTLNIVGSVRLRRGQSISVFVKSVEAKNVLVSRKSGFSVVFIGSDIGIAAMHTVKGTPTIFQTKRWVILNNWLQKKKKSETLFQNGGGWSPPLGVYTVSVSGIYFVSSTIILTHTAVDAYFEVNIGVNKRLPWTNGIQNSRWFYYSKKSRNLNTVTMTVSGLVQLVRGNYVVVRMRSSTPFKWRIEAESGFSIFLVCPLTVFYGCDGFLSRKSDKRIKSPTANEWEKIGGWTTDSALTNGLFLRNQGSFMFEGLLGELVIQQNGIYFVSVNVRIQSNYQLFEIAMGVSPDNKDSVEMMYNGLYATEKKTGKAKGEFTLQFSGALFLSRGQKYHINVRSGSSNSFTVLDGSGFSIARLIYPIEESGFNAGIADVKIQESRKWGNIVKWKTAGEKGLYIDGYNFDPQKGEFIAPLTGIYLVSVQMVLNLFERGKITRVKISVNDESSSYSGLEASTIGPFTENVTLSLGGAMLLNEDTPVRVIIKSEIGSALKVMEGSHFSLRYISTFTEAIGSMADRYSNETFVTQGWHELVTWRTTGDGGQFQVGSIHQTNDRFEVAENGIYIIETNIEFLKAGKVIKIGLGINSGKETAAIAVGSVGQSRNFPLSLHLAVLLSLWNNTYVSVHVYSEDGPHWVISSHSSRSILLIQPEPNTALQGFSAYIPRNRTINALVEDKEWIVVRHWKTSARSGYFQSGEGFLPKTGIFIVRSPGIYIISVNLIILSQLQIKR